MYAMYSRPYVYNYAFSIFFVLKISWPFQYIYYIDIEDIQTHYVDLEQLAVRIIKK